MSEITERLKAALADRYVIERELGAGGMATVYLAEDLKLHRKVAVKVLRPELGAALGPERFLREIEIAAQLHHPHILPLHDSGEADGFLYYVMPFEEGPSLREKLAKEGELPIAEAVRLLRDVVDALAHAHKHGVVHRDIKPDNVLLSDRHALVTDFGVAKAVTDATGRQQLTTAGVALGTPAYMAPEQAAADPHIDHRADIYAVGALAYELLTGRPPFTGTTPQMILAAHVTEAPEPVTKHRPSVPPALATLVMKCLEKKRGDRWQTAEELLSQLDALAAPSGGITPTGTQPVAAVDYEAKARAAHPIRVAGVFALAAVGALAIVFLLMNLIGLPDWVFFGAIVLLLIGWPIMVLTGHHERKRAAAIMTGLRVTKPVGLGRHFTWRKSLFGGGLAFAGLGFVTAGYMAMRSLGIGPVGTLVARGVLDAQDQIIVADFTNRTADSTLGLSLTQALRVGLTESRVIRVADASTVGSALRRMNRDPRTAVDAELAREIAEREGIKAVVAPEIGPIGEGYVLTVRLLGSDGAELLALAETAENSGELIEAIGKLSTRLRERVGESLKTIRQTEPLQQVTTASLEALRQYSIAERAFNVGNYSGAIPALEQAVTLDTSFAMAYRKLAQAHANAGLEITNAYVAVAQAFKYRDRLTTPERYATEGTYWEYVGDFDRAAASYQALLEAYPMSDVARHNLGNIPYRRKDWSAAEAQYREFAEAYPGILLAYSSPLAAQVNQGKFGDAQATIDRMAEHFPSHPWVAYGQFRLATAQGQYEEAARGLQALRDTQRLSLGWQAATARGLAHVASLRGRLAEATRHRQDEMRAAEQRGNRADYLRAAIDLAWLDIGFREAPANGWRVVEAALQRYPLDSIPEFDRPYTALISLAASSGRLDEARAWLAEYETILDTWEARFEGMRRDPYGREHRAAGAVALAEDRSGEAIEQFRQYSAEHQCQVCPHVADLAAAYDRAGESDSVIAMLERYLETPHFLRFVVDARILPGSYRRLGELYEERGEREKAVEYYNKFVELWKDADPELQPQVEDVKRRIAALVGEGRR